MDKNAVVLWFALCGCIVNAQNKSVAELESVYRSHEQDTSVRKQLALAYLNASDFAKAALLYEKTFDQRSCTADEYKIYAAAQMLTYESSVITAKLIDKLLGDKLRHAEIALNEALKADAKDVETQFLFGVYFRIKGDFGRAETILQKIFDQSPDFQTFVFGNVMEELTITLKKQGQSETIKELLNGIIEKNPTAGWAMIEMAKLRLRDQDFKSATEWFYNGLDNADSLLAERLSKEALIIAEKSEIDNWKSLTELASKKQFLKSFWKKRDSNYADPVNDRWAEHYIRLLQAQDVYAAKRHHELDDRGIVYVRMGPPNRFYVEDFWTAWFYEIDGVVQSFMFVDGGDGFYRIGSPHSLLKNRGPAGDFAILLGALEVLSEYDPSFQRLAIQMKGMQSGRVARSVGQVKASYQNDLMQMTQHVVTEFAKREGDINKQFYRFDTGVPILEFNANYACFRNAKDQSRFDFYFMLPFNQMKFYELSENEYASSVSLNMSILDDQYNQVGVIHYDEPVKSGKNEIKTQSLIDELRQALKPGLYHVGFDIRNNEKIGVYKLDLNVRDYSADTLMVSDIQLAASVTEKSGDDKFIKPGSRLRVFPYPAATLAKKQPLNIYYEIYNLTVDNNGKSQYEVAYSIRMIKEKKNFIASAAGIFTKKPKAQTATVTTKNGDSSTEYETIALDISDLPEGAAQLEVKVKDLLAGKESTSTIPLNLTSGKK